MSIQQFTIISCRFLGIYVLFSSIHYVQVLVYYLARAFQNNMADPNNNLSIISSVVPLVILLVLQPIHIVQKLMKLTVQELTENQTSYKGEQQLYCSPCFFR